MWLLFLMSPICSHCLERLLFGLQNAAQLTAAAAASATMFWSGLSDDAPLEPPISAQLRANLEFAGLLDAGWLLGAQLGIRTCRSLLELTREELDVCCMRLICAGFGPGHAAALRGLHRGGLGENLQPGAQLGITAAGPGASGARFAHSTTEKLLAKVEQTRSLLVAVHLSVGAEVIKTEHFLPGCSDVMHHLLHMFASLSAVAAQALCDQASGAELSQELGQMVEQLAALALRNCEDAGAALAARPPGSDQTQQQAGLWAALRVAATELLVWVCARPVALEDLKAQKIAPSLKMRLNAALGCDLADREHQGLASRLGKAKWELFTPEVRRGGKKKKGPRAQTASSSHMEAPASSSETVAPAASTQAAEADRTSAWNTWAWGVDGAEEEGIDLEIPYHI